MKYQPDTNQYLVKITPSKPDEKYIKFFDGLFGEYVERLKLNLTLFQKSFTNPELFKLVSNKILRYREFINYEYNKKINDINV